MASPFHQLQQALKGSSRVRTVGLTGAARAWVLARLSVSMRVPLLCITADDEQADALAEDLELFVGKGTAHAPSVLRLPADEPLPWDELLPDAGVVTERLGALFHLQRGHPAKALVISARGLSKRLIPPAAMKALSREIRADGSVERDELARSLATMGYRNVPLVEDPGTFSVRGDILDVFPPLQARPVRLEFFGDSLESMRSFDPENQRTVAKVEMMSLLPARELFLSDYTKPEAERAIRDAAERSQVPTSKVRERLEQVREGIVGQGLEALLPGFYPGGLATLFDYLPLWNERPLVWVDSPAAQDRALDELRSEVERSHAEAVMRDELTMPPEAHFLSADELNAQLKKLTVIEGGGLSLDSDVDVPLASFHLGSTREVREAIRQHHGEEGALTPLLERLEKWKEAQLTAVISCGTAGQRDKVKRLLGDRGVRLKAHEGPVQHPEQLFDPDITAHLFVGDASAGFIDTDGGLALLSDEEIFGPRARRRTRRRKSGEGGGFAAGFKDLKEGDLVVHAEFGVARYAGLTTMEVNRIKNEFLVLHFAGKDKVYLPVSRMRLLSRFSGADPATVPLDRLGSGAWERTKARVKENLLKMAAELLRLYASRKAHSGHRFTPPDRYFRQFEADFEFEETPDQQKAIDDVLADMAKPESMDRLVCGDVGYGKTEVAMRAAFKCVLDRKQVALLVPTTLLAHQHAHSFQKRLDGYPVTVEVVSSLRKPAEVRDVLRRAREGRVDVLIGTHKLLGGDVSFKDLGLLIIDEEQRFGVKQKEALKKLKTSVDTLTLSATPIPRTLNMAMSGLRDMSLITTPPIDRRAIRTFVNRFDPEQIKEAITREVQRGGQVFFVHNRVSSIYSMEKFLKELVPNVSIAVGHGQMADGELEKVMLGFVDKQTQVLLCTSIIESGIDIPNANTMIVNRADAFGLSQLYQLRGRVGRSKERAYAYLLVPARRQVTKDAERRLEVLQAFTELGRGVFDRLARSRDSRRRQPSGRRAVGRHRSGRLRAVRADARRGSQRDARVAAQPFGRARREFAAAGDVARRVRARRSQSPGALQTLLAGTICRRAARSSGRADRPVR